MVNLSELQADLHALHQTIDEEAPLQNIRIAALRALTRHRFFTTEMLQATGDWEPHLQQEERNRRHEVFVREHQSDLRRLAQEPDGIQKVSEFMLTHVPRLPQESADRASQPLGQFLKYIVHRLASVCLRDRSEEAAEHWGREAQSFETEASKQEAAEEFLEHLPPERRQQFTEEAMECMQERQERSEPGDDWVDMDELLSNDETFEDNRRRILREDAQELQLYLMILERRLEMGNAYSGLDFLNDQETIPWPQEKPDWEPDSERGVLIAKLEALTGKTFRDPPEQIDQ